jgi:plasmid maintenance system killer protein
MIVPQKIFENEKIINYLEKRNLTNQYLKSCKVLLSWVQQWIDFKERKPKWTWVWSFRINKQYRALWYWRGDNFIIVKIDNHQ